MTMWLVRKFSRLSELVNWAELFPSDLTARLYELMVASGGMDQVLHGKIIFFACDKTSADSPSWTIQ